MEKKSIAFVLLPIVLLVFQLAGNLGAQAAPGGSSRMAAATQVSPQDPDPVYLPLVAKASESASWQCYPFGGTACPGGLSSVAMVSASEGWAVGGYADSPYGAILHYTNGAWKAVDTPAKDWLRSVAMVSASEGWAVGDYGSILHYTDGTWQAVDSPTGEQLNSVTMVSANEGWAVGGGSHYVIDDCFLSLGVILHYTNGTWEESSDLWDTILYSVAMVSADEGWAVGIHQLSRCPQGIPYEGIIFHYINGAWQTIDSPTDSWLKSVAMVSATEGWAVGGDGTILHYANGVWQIIDNPTSADLLSVAMVSLSEGWAVGYGGTILHYANGAWQVFDSPTSALLHSVSMVSPSEGWAVGDNVTILHYTDGAWQVVSSPTSAGLLSVAMVSASEGWAVGDGGTILHYINGVWQAVSRWTWYGLFSVAMVSPNEGWAVGGNGTILHYK